MGVDIEKNDVILACSSGVLCASLDMIMDAIFADDLSFEDAHKTGDEIAKEIVKLFAKLVGEEATNKDFSKLLEDFENNRFVKNPIDKLTNDFSGGGYHHINDFAHHPTPVGLFCSIVLNVTGWGTGTKYDSGLLIPRTSEINDINILDRIYYGTLGWFFHLISDIAGSSSSLKKNSDGTGIPGMFLSTIKEISSLPIIDKVGGHKLAEVCQNLFEGDTLGVRFDFRTELGIGIKTKQYISVLLCEGIVSAFYSISRLFNEIKIYCIESVDEFDSINMEKILPIHNDVLTRMRSISSATFTTVDFSSAAVKSYVLSNGSKKEFAKVFLSNINYFGFGRLLISSTGELGIKMEELYAEYAPVICATQEKALSKINPDVLTISDKAFTTGSTIAGMGTPIGFIAAAIGVYKEIKTSSEEYQLAHEDRIRIEKECEEAVAILQEYRDEMEAVVSEYMVDHLMAFGQGMDMMDQALENDDTDAFIKGNNMIQEKLGGNAAFSSQDEFDDLMLSNGDFKL